MGASRQWRFADIDARRARGAATLQLGDGDFVAESAGCAVVSDFRQRDVAAGGEGAPLVGLVDGLLFPSCTRPTALLNLGGMANLTLLVGGAAQLAFDTGPAGALLDGLARRLLGRAYDDGGQVALAGQPQAALVERALDAPWFLREPPKSTGRDSFGEAYVDEFLARARAAGLERSEDVLASAVEVVARSVARALCAWAPEGTDELVLAGGGVHNRALFAALERTSACKVQSSAAHGVDPDAREALAFAALAAACVLERPSSSGVTGARSGRVLGKWSAAPPAAPVPGTGDAEEGHVA